MHTPIISSGISGMLRKAPLEEGSAESSAWSAPNLKINLKGNTSLLVSRDQIPQRKSVVPFPDFYQHKGHCKPQVGKTTEIHTALH